MAYEPHTRVTFGGTLIVAGEQTDQWSCGFRGFKNGPPLGPVAVGDLQAVADSRWGPIAAWFAAQESFIANTTTLTWLKVANIGPDGRYTSDAVIHTGNATGATPQRIPNQCSLVQTLDSGVSLGTGRTGRIYPPNAGVALTLGDAINPDNAATMAQRTADMLYAISAGGNSGPNWTPYIVSSKGSHRAVEFVRVGNLIDVQRRRRNAVNETYRKSNNLPN